MKLLHIDSSVNGANSVSRQLTEHIVELWSASHPDIEIDYLDLASAAPSHLSAESMSFRLPPTATELSEVQKRENILSEALVAQFLAADVVVVGAPLYNFSIPSQLKAWIDRIAQVGRTFKYTESGPVGLATGKTVIVASSRGGIYSTSEASRAMEHQESYLQIIFGFFGITDVRFVRAEGLNMGVDIRARAIAAAQEEIRNLDTAMRESDALIAA
ncbi:FMN-dependent NADH-azoreductase [Paralcaligenes ureilyticus]|uniref:FMN dependent NADH:quinone oxidoreductase n=1 Tax=Paralcaligenes ureilyticus TaxID=627131 RepID=A0A4R3M6I5_9BURK|nr:NAD(P)H-dependent oxidoreductase [Paralcaligenes ureilyticus]TCT08596.1 FMN-dependent NADH-azoreductase [Paralcaligenes ureilyticus]